MKKLSKKVVLVGNFGVGKTSLVRRFIYQKFSDEYLTTLGVKIDKKVLQVGDVEITLIIWDIAGDVSRSKVPNNYFLGSHAIIYVIDLTRSSTYLQIKEEIAYLYQLMGDEIPLCLVGNKTDLLEEPEIQQILTNIEAKVDFLTSAKTGENVNQIFDFIAHQLLK